MSLEAFDQQVTEPEVVSHLIRVLGATAAISKASGGTGITVSRTGTGAYLLTWSDKPGTFVGCTYGIQAATPGDLAGHTVVVDTFDTSALTMPFVLYDGSNNAHDLVANEWITLAVMFKRTSS